MAEATTSSVLCRYFLSGMCRDGERCSFSHDKATGRPDNVCRYYQMGACSYGVRCRYDHVKIKPQQTRSKSRSNSSVPAPPPPRQPLTATQSCNMPQQPSQFVTLKKHGSESSETSSSTTSTIGKKPEDWVKAEEFVPGRKWQGAGPSSYLQAAGAGIENNTPSMVIYEGEAHPRSKQATSDADLVCPYAAQGSCRFGDSCTYLHGDICDTCLKAALHPSDEEQRNKHSKECLAKLEEDMELAFAVQRSKDKACGICMENIMEKNHLHEQRFGILSNCSHVFCLSCIRTWRAAKQFENKIVRACPECRIKSDFVTPSKFWVEDKEEKTKLIEGYKGALSKKPCKYFDQGRGDCPFNENCFYRHAYPDGRPASPKPKGRRKRQNAEGDLDLVQQIILWDFLEERSIQAQAIASYLDDEWEEIFLHLNLAPYSSDDDSSASDVEVLL